MLLTIFDQHTRAVYRQWRLFLANQSLQTTIAVARFQKLTYIGTREKNINSEIAMQVRLCLLVARYLYAWCL